jgi:predicted transcriptional regulator
MDEKKALRISQRERAVELFATNPDIEAKRVAELLDVTPQIVYEYRRDPNFHMQVQDRFMAELENDIPSMVSALKREVLAGNVQATRLMFEYMNKLQKNINITIDSPFESWMKKEGFTDVKDAEVINDMPEFRELPPRTDKNNHLEIHKERLRVQNAPKKERSLVSHNKTRREQYKWVKRAKAVGVDKLPGKRPTPGQKKAWQEKIIAAEKKASAHQQE